MRTLVGMGAVRRSLFVRQPIGQTREGGHALARVLGPVSLVALGIGAIVGTGIFVLTGTAAAEYAGPAVVLSFVLAGVGSAFAGLCYAELASMLPRAGSAYAYAYATLGELPAWIIGWDLVLEYLFGAATVAVGWSGYVVSALADLGIHVAPQWAHAPGVALLEPPGSPSFIEVTPELLKQLQHDGVRIETLPHAVGTFNLVAALAIIGVTALLVIGIHESARFNTLIVGVKLVVIVAFIVAGLVHVLHHRADALRNWEPFVPANTGEWGRFGWSGILRAAGVVFFAYIGFDAVSTAAQEARKPQRDMPIGILGSLFICTVLYVIVSGVLTALVPYGSLNVAEPIAVGVRATGHVVLTGAVKIGAIAGLSSVMLVLLLGQPRIFFAMSEDGLLPPVFHRVHPRFRTPFVSTVLTGIVCAGVAGSVPLARLGELVSIGTLLAFILVCAGVWILRRREPELQRAFRTPGVPLVPLAGILVCGLMMLSLPLLTWIRLGAWMAVGLVIYFAYGRRHAVLR